MLNFKSLSKILFNILKVIVYGFLILFSFICIIALYQIYTEKDGFNISYSIFSISLAYYVQSAKNFFTSLFKESKYN